MNKRSYLWALAVAGLVAAFVLAALILPQSLGLKALSDLIQCILLVSGAVSFVPMVLRSEGRMRLFWSLITLGISFWLAYQLLWTYFEVILRRDVPDLFAGDVILFLHIVPMMAAIALRPHSTRDEYGARVGRLDFALLAMWWLYLYVLIVIPWQYVVADTTAYNRHLNAVYVTEEIAFLLGLIACWITSKGYWRNLYANLFGMSLCYASSSTVMNWAIGRKLYYSGSLYDIPYVAAIAWLTWIGLRARAEKPTSDAREASTLYGVWIARCSMISVFSLPIFAAWAMSDNSVPSRVGVFRLALTLLAAFCMGVLVLVRQHLLDQELTQLLYHSRQSVDSLKQLQAQILQSEKLASIGQLVGGAAHELNNPITAMLGYSDMLLSTRLTAEQQPLAGKIGLYVRRTKSLVASLISFARQAPSPKAPIDLNTLARTAIKLTQPQWEPLAIEVRTQFDSALPKVLGDSNQLLQVCLQLLGNCLHVLSEGGGHVLTITSERVGETSVLQIATETKPGKPSEGSAPSAPLDAEDNLGLNACQGIIHEHRGQILRERREDGALLLRVELPITQSAPSRTKESTVPVMWQPRPYA
ncbi:MAG TPA: histidine kinase dimerization/phospho-acceptor domain-containing protein [Candidatus Sulfotelmatobacter sp.]|nr:histidine kinase dimerization/phospho-acceptor domain-containing protein [Candidatus Sulfotelmatobacter sp.]